MYYLTIQQFKKILTNISGLLDKAVQYSETKKFDIGNLLNARLAPDQFNFIRQVQIACDNAKYTAARLCGKEAPKHEDNEKTVGELKERINTVVEYLNSYTENDFTGAAERKIVLPFRPTEAFSGEEYLIEFSIPNFYFHVCTAYAILRHNGVDIGKRDYIGNIYPKNVYI